MAAPVVSAAAALLIQQNPRLTPDQVKARLMKTAYKNLPPAVTIVTGTQTFIEQADIFTLGAGYLDIQAALSDTSLALLSAKSPTAVYDRPRATSTWREMLRQCGGATPCGAARRFGGPTRLSVVR